MAGAGTNRNQGEKSGQVLPFSRMAIWLFGYHHLSLGTGQYSAAAKSFSVPTPGQLSAALTLFCDNRRGHRSQPRGKIRAGFTVQLHGHLAIWLFGYHRLSLGTGQYWDSNTKEVKMYVSVNTQL
jgi:hypothetical protein